MTYLFPIPSSTDPLAWHDGGDAFGPGAELGTSGANAINLETNGLTRATITSAGNLEIPTTLDLILLDQNELQLRDAVGTFYSYLKYGAETTALADEFVCHIGSVAPGVGEIGFKTQGGFNTFLFLDVLPASNQLYARLQMVGDGNMPVELRHIRKPGAAADGEVLLTAEGGTNNAQLSVKGDHGVSTTGAWYDKTTEVAVDITLNETNRLVTLDAALVPIGVALPALAGVLGCRYGIKKIDSSANAITINPNGAETIDGAATATLGAQYDSISISAGATEWHVW
jgi:hypothetical protein